jgi:regulator of RNase E activity RraA
VSDAPWVPPVSAIADVLAMWGRDGWLTPPLYPLVPSPVAIVAPLRIVEVHIAGAGPGLRPLHEVLSERLDGRFVLIAGAREAAGAVWGEILSTAALLRGAAGVLLDGAARDRAGMAGVGLPVYAASQAVGGPAGTAHVIALDVGVTIDAVEVEPDDVVAADTGGCVRIPTAEIEAVLEGAARYAAAEELVVEALRGGHVLTDAYHHKQAVVAELRR